MLTFVFLAVDHFAILSCFRVDTPGCCVDDLRLYTFLIAAYMMYILSATLIALYCLV